LAVKVRRRNRRSPTEKAKLSTFVAGDAHLAVKTEFNSEYVDCPAFHCDYYILLWSDSGRHIADSIGHWNQDRYHTVIDCRHFASNGASFLPVVQLFFARLFVARIDVCLVYIPHADANGMS
jgi:hypothetical protein